MNSAEWSQLRRLLHGRRDAIADSWYRAMATTCYVPLKAAEVHLHLAGLTEQAIALLLTEPFEHHRAEAIGASLARLHYLQPEALGRTQEILTQQLAEGLPADQVIALQPRLTALLGGLAAGFFQQAVETILAEQEQTRSALVTELRRVEEALRKAHDEVEIRVKKRTAELAKANEALRAEIAERKRMEKALRESEENFRALAENAHDGILIAAGEEVYAYANKRAAEITGYSVAELLKLGMKDLTPPDEIEELIDRYRKRLEGRSVPRQYESIVVRKDGKSVPIELTAARTIWQGQTAGMIIFRDITERKRAEEALRESEEKYRNVVERANDGICIIQDTIVKYANPHLAAMWGGTVEEVVGTPFTHYVHPDKFSEVVERYQRRMAGEEVEPIYESVLRRKDGSKVYAELNVGIITYQGRLAELIIVRDITERKRMEEVLQAAIQEWRTTFNAINDAICLLDMKGRVQRCNKAMMDLLGKPFNEIIDHICCELVHGTSEPIRGCPYVRMRETHRRETLVLPKGDRWFDVATDPLLDEESRLVGAVHIMTDITERVQAEEMVREHGRDLQRLSVQLINAQEAERERISRELHDEMGQALTAMRINLATIEKGLPPGCSPAIRERLAETRSQAQQILEQIRKLSHDLRPSMLDDLGLVPALRWYVNQYTQRLNIEVEFEAIDFQERLTMEVETVLYRVVQEALTNVAKHAQAHKVWIRLERKDTTVAASIEDDGQGFDIQKVAGRAAPERGTGLIGMRERVTSLGGRFRIQSRPGQGTRLTIEIPVHLR